MTVTTTITTLDWLNGLYCTTTEGHLNITGIHEGEVVRSLWAPINDLERLLADTRSLREKLQLYFGVAPRKQPLPGTLRGGDDDCLALPALFLDIDTIEGHGKHNSKKPLPATLEEAHQILNEFPMPPSSIIYTGGGLQAWWAFTEPVEAAIAIPLLQKWKHTWGLAFAKHGYKPDNVFDLARIMRLPNTYNQKGEPPTLVTIHTVDWDQRYGVDDIEQWLTAPPDEPERSPSPPPTTAGPDMRPGTDWIRRTTWPPILTHWGYTFLKKDPAGEEYWTRPGKDPRHGHSVTINYKGSDLLKVFSGAIQELEAGKTYDRFAFLAHMQFGGDYAAATRWLVEQGYGTPAVERIDPATLIATLPPPDTTTTAPADTSWVPYDLAPYTDDNYQDPEPTILTRPDGRALIYPEAVNALFGAPGVGKTWVALAAITQHLQAGHKAAFIDLEDHPGKLVKRLKTFGLTNQQITTQFAYIRPDSITYPEAIQATQQLANDGYNLLIIDSYGELLGLAGLDEYSNPDVTANTQGLLRPIVRQGHALIVIDHVIKSNEGTRGYAIGAQRKKAMIDGASWELSSDGYSREKAGTIHLHCAKDRNGWYANREHAADLHLTPTGTRIEWELTVPQDAPDEDAPHGAPNTPTVLMERISQYLADCGANDPQTARNICQAVKGQDSHLRRGLRQLVEQGYVAELDGYNGHPRYANKYEYTEAGSLIEPPPNDDRWYP